MTNFNLPSSTAVHPCDVYPESSGMIQIPQTLNPVQESPLVSEPSCAVCLKSCNNAHLCPECQLPVHTICGYSVAGMEGYGAPVWCVRCYLNERKESHEKGRTAAKRDQDKQIQRMEKQSVKKARILDIGDNILIPIPEVDKRSPFEPINLPGVITHRSEEGYYKIGTHAGTLDRHYLSTEVELSHGNFLTPTDVPSDTVTLRQAALACSLGKYRLSCNCTGGCGSNRCKCRRIRRICNSKCHSNVLASTNK